MISITAMTTMCVDVFDATGEILPGGEALNFACTASRYDDISVGIVGAIGSDSYGEKVLKSLEGRKIDQSTIHVIENGETASNRIYLTEEGDRYFKEDSWTNGVYGSYRLSSEDIVKMKESDVVFINYSSPNFTEVLHLRKTGDFLLAVDFDMDRDFVTQETIAPYVDFFFISGEEKILSQYKTLSEKYGGIFNVTLAAAGSVSYYHGREYRVSAVPVEKIVDTTGCGDSYHAAFICRYMRDQDIMAAMKEGSRAAADILMHVGGLCDEKNYGILEIDEVT